LIDASTRFSQPPVWLGQVFDRLVCGVDGTENSRAAARQAARLLSARRLIQFVAVVEEPAVPLPPDAAHAEFDRRCEQARVALAATAQLCPRAYRRIAFGDASRALATAARELPATLVVFGAPRSRRLGGIVLGSVGTHLLHDAAGSVLVARASGDDEAFPRSIVVGHDGSRNAAAAAAVAKELAQRFDAELRLVVATGGDPVGVDELAREPELAWSDLRPVDALVEASEHADLLVVGSRGLRGLRSLGSVSERVGHLARSSVLVVREPPGSPGPKAKGDDAVPDLEPRPDRSSP
jgi:nucleotide-binding universal stress UspA family protein